MDPTTASPRSARARAAGVALVATVTAVAAAAYLALRAPGATAIHERMQATCAHLGMRAGDAPCAVSATRVLVLYLAASLAIGAALALPVAILAATGRRGSALLPIAAPLAAWLGWVAVVGVDAWLSGTPIQGWSDLRWFGPPGSGFDAGPTGSLWAAHPLLMTAVDVALLCAPAVAVAIVVRGRAARRRAPVARPARRARWLAVAATAVAAIALGWVAARASDPLGIAGVSGSRLGWGISVAQVYAFGALLGTDRRWWPWAIAPVAILATLAPSDAAIGAIWRYDAFGSFSAAIPLALVGLVATLREPLARLLDRRTDAERAAPPDLARRSAIRRAVVHGAAGGLLAASAIAGALDPLGIQIATPLPTFLGIRERANDRRALTNLDEALAAVGAVRGRTFTAADGEAVAPSLAWSNQVPGEPLVVGVVASRPARTELVVRSGSGAAYCARSEGVADPIVTYGSARTPGTPEAVVRRARAACGDRSWTGPPARPLPVDTLCAGAEDPSIMVCRAVQRLVRATLTTPAPAGR